MATLKRVLIWLLERLLEACALGVIFEVLMIQSANSASTSVFRTHIISSAWISAAVVAFALFVDGYYITTAIFGVFWRSEQPWKYAAITAVLFALHTHIIFLLGTQDFTREARTIELPLIICGVPIVLTCCFGGSKVLRLWTNANRSPNLYLSGGVLTLFAFPLLNVASFLRPVTGELSFRPYGLPFTFYRAGGYVRQWVWQGGVIVWGGVIADLVIVAGVAVLAGMAAQRLRAHWVS